MAPDNSPPRADTRYGFEIPVVIELSRGLFRPADRVAGTLVDMSKSGAAITTSREQRLKLKKRYRVIIDDRSGIIMVRNLVVGDDGMVRLGVEFKSLGLELQEIVSDVLDEAQWVTSRLVQTPSMLVDELTTDR